MVPGKPIPDLVFLFDLLLTFLLLLLLTSNTLCLRLLAVVFGWVFAREYMEDHPICR